MLDVLFYNLARLYGFMALFAIINCVAFNGKCIVSGLHRLGQPKESHNVSMQHGTTTRYCKPNSHCVIIM